VENGSELDRMTLTPAPPPPEPRWTARERDLLAGSLSAAVLGVGALWILADKLARPWARPAIFLGVLAASIGPALAALVLVAPRRSAIATRHIVAGISAAWACIELAGAARRLGIAADSGLFRAAWAPVVEELCKAIFLAVMFTARDRDGDRRSIVTASVAVGAGFAFRENVVYFASALDGSELPLGWLVLRAVPPVFAHTLFGATFGTILAQAAIHARALELAPPRFSSVALLLATLAHVAYNAIPWAVLTVAPEVTLTFALLWSALALAGTWAISRRVRAMSHEDPSTAARVSIVASSVSERTTDHAIDQRAAIASAALLALWAVPLALPRYLAVVFSPFALATLAVLALARALGVERAFVWVLFGVSVRPLFAMSEAALSAIPLAIRHPIGVWIAVALGTALWSLSAAALGRSVAAKRGPSSALVAAAGLAGGLVAASIGGNLAAGVGYAPWRELLGGLLRFLPRTVALSMLVAWWATHPSSTRFRSWLLLPLALGPLVAIADVALARGRLFVAVPLAVAFVSLAVGLGAVARRSLRDRSRAPTQPVGEGDLPVPQGAAEALVGDQSALDRSGHE
jgi:hypothetical protein